MLLASKAFDKISIENRLIQVNINGIRSDTPREVNAKKEPLYDAHKVHLTSFGKEPAEEGFHRGIIREVNEVVDVHAKT